MANNKSTSFQIFETMISDAESYEHGGHIWDAIFRYRIAALGISKEAEAVTTQPERTELLQLAHRSKARAEELSTALYTIFVDDGDYEASDDYYESLLCSCFSIVCPSKPKIPISGLERQRLDMGIALELLLKQAQVFRDEMKPCYSCIMFGAQGCGKTDLLNAVCFERDVEAIFTLHISNLLLVSPDDSAGIVRHIIHTAQRYTSSVIVINKLEYLYCNQAIPSSYMDLGAEILKLIHLKFPTCFVVAETNAPYNLPLSLYKEFDKHVFVQLPDAVTRINIFSSYLNKDACERLGKPLCKTLAKATEGFSGADIENVCSRVLRKSLEIQCHMGLTSVVKGANPSNTVDNVGYFDAEKARFPEVGKGQLRFKPVIYKDVLLHEARQMIPTTSKKNIEMLSGFAMKHVDYEFGHESGISSRYRNVCHKFVLLPFLLLVAVIGGVLIQYSFSNEFI